MSAIMMDGKALAADIKRDVKEKALSMEHPPTLALVLVGDDPASVTYVTHKRRDCAECGIRTVDYTLGAETTQEELLGLVAELNGRRDVDGILVQLPLPSHIHERTILEAIDPKKDVDAFHPFNVGRLMQFVPCYVPCTPAGIMALLRRYDIDPAGKECVIINRSNIVGKPLAMLLLQAGGTVTVCHSRTADLARRCRQADILIAAAGKAGLVTADMIKPGAVVVGVSMARDDAGHICGDFGPAVGDKASYLTPPTGGVGPMTRAMLMVNVLKAAELRGE